MPKISIIVPVYNVEQYLKRCLDSLVNQTIKDIEIIIVNDGSPDHSQDIINEYSRKYSNIKSYIKENGGLSDARNFGITKATGDYFAFLDSDDWVENNIYEKLYNKAIEHDFDMVVANLQLVDDTHILKVVTSGIDNDLLTLDSIKKAYINIYPVAWNKIFKRSLFTDEMIFKKGVWFEDVEFIYRILLNIKSIGCIDDIGFNYYQRFNSISNTYDKRLYHYIDNWNGIIAFYKNKNILSKYYKELEYSYVRYIYATFVKRALNYQYNDFQEAVNTAIINVKKHFPHYHRNKYFYQSKKGIYLLLFNRFLANILYKSYQRRG